jgi:hypothetical protein
MLITYYNLYLKGLKENISGKWIKLKVKASSFKLGILL